MRSQPACVDAPWTRGRRLDAGAAVHRGPRALEDREHSNSVHRRACICRVQIATNLASKSAANMGRASSLRVAPGAGVTAARARSGRVCFLNTKGRCERYNVLCKLISSPVTLVLRTCLYIALGVSPACSSAIPLRTPREQKVTIESAVESSRNSIAGGRTDCSPRYRFF